MNAYYISFLDRRRKRKHGRCLPSCHFSLSFSTCSK
jgi:signal recognition particle subunit SEC65